ncbi:MAG: hypothetical protein R3C59_06080 [Planctomycetaceae bacterium]
MSRTFQKQRRSREECSSSCFRSLRDITGLIGNTMCQPKLNGSRWLLLIAILCFLAPRPVIAQDAETAPTEAQVITGKATTAEQPTTDRVTFARMPIDQVRTELLQWLAATGTARDKLESVTARWADTETLAGLSGEELLDLLVESFAQVDRATAGLVEGSYGAGPLEEIVFDGIRESTIFRNQVQQYRARWMVQHRFYDDALPLLSELLPENVVDPAGLLFYRAVCESQLLKRQAALDSVSLLLNNTLDVPDRFRVVAEMLQEELSGQTNDGMNLVKQLMQDVERRLDLGRSGEKTQEQEGEVIAALDKLLEEMEKEQDKQNGGGGGSGSPQNQPAAQGAIQSQIKGSPADGEADRKKLTENGKWGMLDKQAEAKARELIRQKFPSNFLDQIGRYTKKIAEQKE